ncbi:MAG: outer membrane beta-barrel protein, partial [Myxococcota bacterium]|nr:outer membrane beta-barrel protein [Myxococcota bacterium]
MRSIFTTVAITAAGLLLFSGFAQASDVEAELRQMQERITDLESQLGSETDSFLPQEESGSFVSAMLENTDIGGFAAGSYNYNFEGFHNSNPDGTAYNNNPSHATSNTFQVDQVWVSIANAATEDSRGGFNVDYEWGAVNGAGAGGELYAASVSYLAPVLGGVNLDLGLVPTMIGAEVNQTNGNLNVTRGIVWGIQPVTNLGAVASMQATDSISISFGVLND